MIRLKFDAEEYARQIEREKIDEHFVCQLYSENYIITQRYFYHGSVRMGLNYLSPLTVDFKTSKLNGLSKTISKPLIDRYMKRITEGKYPFFVPTHPAWGDYGKNVPDGDTLSMKVMQTLFKKFTDVVLQDELLEEMDRVLDNVPMLADFMQDDILGPDLYEYRLDEIKNIELYDNQFVCSEFKNTIHESPELHPAYSKFLDAYDKFLYFMFLKKELINYIGYYSGKSLSAAVRKSESRTRARNYLTMLVLLGSLEEEDTFYSDIQYIYNDLYMYSVFIENGADINDEGFYEALGEMCVTLNMKYDNTLDMESVREFNEYLYRSYKEAYVNRLLYSNNLYMDACDGGLILPSYEDKVEYVASSQYELDYYDFLFGDFDGDLPFVLD